MVGILILAIVGLTPMVHAEANTLGIGIVEQINRADTYHPYANGMTGGTFTAGSVSGTGTITLTNNAGVALTDINVQFAEGSTNTWAIDTTAAANKVTAGTISESSGTATVHIPLLATGQYAVVTYTIADTVKTPAYLTASYADNKVIAYNGANTTVTLTATRDNAALPAGTSITGVSATSAPAAGWSFNTTSFTFDDLTVASPTSARTATVTITDSTKFPGSNQVNEQLLATTTLSFTVLGSTQSLSGVSVSGATAKTSNIGWDLQKQLSSGSWLFTPKVYLQSNDPITYTLSAVTVWATSNTDLNTQLASQTYNSGTLPADLTGTGSWTGAAWTWDPGAFSGIPVGFIKPTVNVKYTGTQFPLQYTDNGGSGATLAKYIYVANGYLIEVTKTVAPVGGSPGQYDVTIHVYNKGNKDAPDVIVYDIIPNTFSLNAGTVSPVNTGSTGIANVQGITGMAYWWDVGTLASTTGTSTITYRITALNPNSYPLTDVYVVGVDPALSLNLQSTPFISEADAAASAVNYEALSAVSVICLFMVGMFGLVRRNL